MGKHHHFRDLFKCGSQEEESTESHSTARTVSKENGSPETSSRPVSNIPTRIVAPPAPPSAGTGNPSTGANDTPPAQSTALADAIKKHADRLKPEERQRLENASKNLTDETLLTRVKAFDDENAHSSLVRKTAEPVGKFFGLLGRFMDILSTAGSASPEISVAVGAVRVIIDLGLKFVRFFGKLSDMLGRFADFLGPLAEFGRTSEEIVQHALTDTYGDLLDFCSRVQRVFVNDDGETRRFASWRIFWRIQWVPFEDEFGGIESNLQHHLQALGLASSATGVNAALEVQRQQRIEKRENFLNWLSPISHEQRFEEIYAKKHKDTADWILHTAKFEGWFNGTASSLLWCYGGPGTGKSVLASNVLRYIERERSFRDHVGTAFFFCNFRDTDTQALPNILCSLLKQLCRHLDVIPRELLDHKENALPVMTVGTLESLESTAGQYAETFLVFDALDERPEPHRQDLIDFIRTIIGHVEGVKVFATSRDEDDIRSGLELENTQLVTIKASDGTSDDIAKFVQDEVQRLQDVKRLHIKDPEVAAEVIQSLIKGADTMFLWVQLQLHHVCEASKSRKDSEVRKALTSLPKGLDATYSHILERIEDQEDYMRDLALQTINLVLRAERPLALWEIQSALMLQKSTADSADEEMDDLEVIISSCGGLVTTTPRSTVIFSVGRNPDDYPIFRLTHTSVSEFFKKASIDGATDVYRRLSDAPNGHLEIATACVKCMSSPAMQAGPLDNNPLGMHPLEGRFQKLPFLWYAAHHFDYHILESPKGDLEAVQKLLDSDDRLFAAIFQVRDIIERRNAPEQAWLGEAMGSQVNEQATGEVHAADFVYFTRLHLRVELQSRWQDFALDSKSVLNRAVRAGYLDVIQKGQPLTLSVHERDNAGLTPLLYAIDAGNAEIVRALLDNGANPNTEYPIHKWGGYDFNALHRASALANIGIIKLLISHGADINVKGNNSGTALQSAAKSSQEDAVKLLLKSGAEVNAEAAMYKTALQAAASRGAAGVVKLLLDNRAKVNTLGGLHHTALQAAARCGSLETVEVLLDAGADVNAKGGIDGTALAAAKSGNFKKVVDRLVAAGAHA